MMKIKYEDMILSAFEKYKLEPRDNQLALINDILVAYETKEYVVLSAPTGTGKSIIAVIVAECMSVIEKLPKASSYILMHTNTLAKQYRQSFDKYGNDFVTIMGASNYKCEVLSDTADNCVVKEVVGGARLKCNSCEFLSLRNRMTKTPHFITNYSYYFVSSLYNTKFENRQIAVFDEAHLINDVFSSHMSITVSIKNMKYYLQRIQRHQTTSYNHFKKVFDGIIRALKIGKVDMSNYMALLLKLKELYVDIQTEYGDQASKYFASNNLMAFTAYIKIAKMFGNMHGSIHELETQNYEFVVDIKDTEMIISPIFVGNMFPKINKAKYHLFMSATVDDSFISTTLGISKRDIAYIKSPPVFKPENKSIVFVDHDNYNYTKMQNDSIKRTMGELIAKISQEHADDNGIILTASFAITEFASKVIRKTLGDRLLEHERGTNLDTHLQKHKTMSKPTVLISPSLFEGVDLPNDQSRFQIFVKAPYPSLADKRIKYIANNYPDIYEIMTIYKIIQGLGRSTRNSDDYSVSYTLDKNISRLFKGSKNKWKDEFKVV